MTTAGGISLGACVKLRRICSTATDVVAFGVITTSPVLFNSPESIVWVKVKSIAHATYTVVNIPSEMIGLPAIIANEECTFLAQRGGQPFRSLAPGAVIPWPKENVKPDQRISIGDKVSIRRLPPESVGKCTFARGEVVDTPEGHAPAPEGYAYIVVNRLTEKVWSYEPKWNDLTIPELVRECLLTSGFKDKWKTGPGMLDPPLTIMWHQKALYRPPTVERSDTSRQGNVARSTANNRNKLMKKAIDSLQDAGQFFSVLLTMDADGNVHQRYGGPPAGVEICTAIRKLKEDMQYDSISSNVLTQELLDSYNLQQLQDLVEINTHKHRKTRNECVHALREAKIITGDSCTSLQQMNRFDQVLRDCFQEVGATVVYPDLIKFLCAALNKDAESAAGSKVHLVMGAPGTGKSLTLQAVRLASERLEAQRPGSRRSTIAIAPTWATAILISGQSSHSVLMCNLEELKACKLAIEAICIAADQGDEQAQQRAQVQVDVEFDKLFTHIRPRLHRSRLFSTVNRPRIVLCDEIFQDDVAILYLIHLCMLKLFGGTDPFAGLLLIWFGDAYQLMGVDNRPITRVSAWMRYLLPTANVIELQQIHRQTNVMSAAIVSHIRQAVENDQVKAEMAKRVRGSCEDQRALIKSIEDILEEAHSLGQQRPVVLTPHHKTTWDHGRRTIGCDVINRYFLEKLPGDPVIFDALDDADNQTLTEPIRRCLDQLCPRRLSLKPKEPVVFNNKFIDHIRGVVAAGSMGIVEWVNRQNAQVKLNDGRDVIVRRTEFILPPDSHGRMLSRRQLPVLPAWAITIHRSTGATYSSVILVLHTCFQDGQVNLACSRCSDWLTHTYVLGPSDPIITAEAHIDAIWRRITVPDAARIIHDYASIDPAPVLQLPARF